MKNMETGVDRARDRERKIAACNKVLDEARRAAGHVPAFTRQQRRSAEREQAKLTRKSAVELARESREARRAEWPEIDRSQIYTYEYPEGETGPGRKSVSTHRPPPKTAQETSRA